MVRLVISFCSSLDCNFPLATDVTFCYSNYLSLRNWTGSWLYKNMHTYISYTQHSSSSVPMWFLLTYEFAPIKCAYIVYKKFANLFRFFLATLLENSWTISVKSVTSLNNVSPSNNSHICPRCEKAYTYKKNLSRHLRYECGQLPTEKCRHCSYVARYKHSLNMHVKTQHPEQISDTFAGSSGSSDGVRDRRGRSLVRGLFDSAKGEKFLDYLNN